MASLLFNYIKLILDYGSRYNPMDEMHSASGSMSLKEASLTEPSKANQSESCVDLQNPEAVNANSNIGKGTTLPTTKGNENSTDGTCDNAEKAPIRRLSPEGAECNAVDAQMTDAAGDTNGYLTVPGKKVVRTQRRDFVGSPSGRLDVKNYWLSDDVVEGNELNCIVTRVLIGQFIP